MGTHNIALPGRQGGAKRPFRSASVCRGGSGAAAGGSRGRPLLCGAGGQPRPRHRSVGSLMIPKNNGRPVALSMIE
jgi:hypothetical protein